MKSPDAATRAMRFEADEKMRKVSDLEQMIYEFEQVATDLERQIHAEEERTGVRDPAHYNYSTFARSAAQRRNNLLVSAAGLKARLDEAIQERDAFMEQMDRLASVEQRPSTVNSSRNRSRSGNPQSSQIR
jgi:flagellar FliJ protein